MNYRHQYHAGNFADVMKHALLLELVRSMARKDKGYLYVDTHSGRGGYDLQTSATGLTLERTPEWPEGIGRLWAQPDLPEVLRPYVTLMRQYDAAEGNDGPTPRFYPGSPWIARSQKRPQDRMALFEQHPEEAEALEIRFCEKGVKVTPDDGYGAAAALFPPPERRGLMLIDPPFEAQDEWRRIAETVTDAFHRFESAVIAVWYPIAARANQASFMDFWQGGGLPPTLAAELLVDPDGPGLQGCGLLVFNPPWQFDRQAESMGHALAQLLAKSSSSKSTVTWPVPEKSGT